MGNDRTAEVGTVKAARTAQQAEDKLRESEEEFRMMFEHSSVGQCQADPITGRVIRVNRKICEMTGYSDEELTARTIGELMYSEGREALGLLLQQLLCQEIPEICIDVGLLRRDGPMIWAQLQITLFQGSLGQAPRLLALLRDITARKQTEQKLYEAEERMRLATQAAGVFAWDVDLMTGTIKYSENMARMFGYEILPERFVSVPGATNVIHPEDREAVIEAARPAFEQTGTFSAQCRAEAAGGRYIWVQCNGTVVRDANNNPVRFVGIVQNIDDRKRAEQALQASQERLRRAIQIETVGVIFFKPDGNHH